MTVPRAVLALRALETLGNAVSASCVPNTPDVDLEREEAAEETICVMTAVARERALELVVPRAIRRATAVALERAEPSATATT